MGEGGAQCRGSSAPAAGGGGGTSAATACGCWRARATAGRAWSRCPSRCASCSWARTTPGPPPRTSSSSPRAPPRSRACRRTPPPRPTT
eukprot:scaffold94_cov340-Prasinococcus_capsulatus_cf.AAC.21